MGATAIETLFYSQVTNQVIAILSPWHQQLQCDKIMELKEDKKKTSLTRRVKLSHNKYREDYTCLSDNLMSYYVSMPLSKIIPIPFTVTLCSPDPGWV